MLASPVEESRRQMFHVHFTRPPGHVIGRDTNVPYGVQPNPSRTVWLSLSPPRNFGILIMLLPRLTENGVRLDSHKSGGSNTVMLDSASNLL